MRIAFGRTIAASEIAGGVIMLALLPISATGGMPLHGWYALLLLGLGGSSLAAGLWLWRDDPRGLRWSRPLQGLQVLQVRTATWGLGLKLGLHVDLYVGAAGAGFTGGLTSRLDLLIGTGMPFMVTVNLFSLAAFIALVRARDAEPVVSELTVHEPSSQTSSAEQA